jgi:hypothetical protein
MSFRHASTAASSTADVSPATRARASVIFWPSSLRTCDDGRGVCVCVRERVCGREARGIGRARPLRWTCTLTPFPRGPGADGWNLGQLARTMVAGRAARSGCCQRGERWQRKNGGALARRSCRAPKAVARAGPQKAVLCGKENEARVFPTSLVIFCFSCNHTHNTHTPRHGTPHLPRCSASPPSPC